MLAAIVFLLAPAAALPQDWEEVYKGIAVDQVKSYMWFRDAAKSASPQIQGGLGALYNLGLMDDLGQEGLREQLESYEWFQKAVDPGSQDIKSLLQKMR